MHIRKRSFYEKYVKRLIDIIISVVFLIIFGWLLVLLAILVRIKLGAPVLFKQPRPGIIDPKTQKEKIFLLCKFRSMSNERDENGELLPDEKRLGRFGKLLRATSLDELPEILNILSGKMSFVGPRPQLVKDMVFMGDEERIRHTALPGLTGLAQIKGRNSISWEEKFKWDIEYINNISFFMDLKISIVTAFDMLKGLFGKNNPQDTEITLDYGDYLLEKGLISREKYSQKIVQAKEIIKEYIVSN